MNNEISTLLNKLDGSGSDSEYKAVDELRQLGNQLPALLYQKYKQSKKWGQRASCLYHSTRYARDVEDAVMLGVLALNDKSKAVRYRACMLLAYSLNLEVLPALEQAKISTDSETLKDINAAIDAIKHQNSNYFVDRSHSGKISLNVN
ncbi:MAG: hypothetical protein B0W54_00735 [Cellvibrio sp. 79]|nr:MAG: hypothetical protein B0W54_00735 [Cellvibrio sp. 79]